MIKSSESAIQFIGYWFVACPAALRASEKRFAARRAMIAFTFCPRPIRAALLITELCYLVSPERNRSFHYSDARGKAEILYHGAWPVPALMARIKLF